MLAPIVIFAFNRPHSLSRLIADLERNPLYAQSDKFVYVDGSRCPDDEEKVNEVIRVARTTDARITISKKNKGLCESIIDGVSDVMSRYGKAIVLEDDLRLMPGFLQFMNNALDMYQADERIISVCGYGLKIRRPKGYVGDVYLSPRASSWGWGTWVDRWNSIDWSVSDWDKFRSDRKAHRAFNRGGSDMYGMLRDYMEGRNHSWAIRFCYSQFRQERYSVHPFLSFVDNEGFGENATNCRQRHSRFRVERATGCQVFTPPPIGN